MWWIPKAALVHMPFWELEVKADQPLRSIDEKTFVFCAFGVGEERSVLEELINTKSCARLVALVRLNL